MKGETCQRGCTGIPVDARGRTLEHTAYAGMPGFELFHPCLRVGHPSREELARRKAARAAKREALVAEVRPEAIGALDAYLERRPEYADRIEDFKRAALFEFNRANKTRHRYAFFFTAHGLEGDSAFPRTYQCRYCRGRMQVPAVSSEFTYSMATIERAFAPHLAQCALEYLAGLRPAASAEHRQNPDE